jgi:hypothetical protein
MQRLLNILIIENNENWTIRNDKKVKKLISNR